MTANRQSIPGPEPLHDVLMGIVRHAEFADAIIEAIDAHLPPHETELREHSRHAAFNSLVGRVVKKAETHPRRYALSAFMSGDDLPTEEAFAALDFVYSGILNHVKGELGELLAQPLLNEAAVYLAAHNLAPPGARFVAGHMLTTPRVPGQAGQYKSADAVLAVTTDQWSSWASPKRDLPAGRWIIVAAAEIKAKRPGLARTFEQIADHLDRFRFGLCLSGAMLNASDTFVALDDGEGNSVCVPCTTALDPARFARLVIRPRVASRPPCLLEKWQARAWTSELPFTSADLLEAAFRFAIWLVTQMGSDTLETADPPTRSVPANSSEMQDRFLQALYHFGRRESFQAKSRKQERIARTFFWLYNSLCYGRKGARGDRLQWPEEHPDLPRAYPVQQLTDAEKTLAQSWDEYARGRIPHAAQLLSRACAEGIRDIKPYRAAWLEGMIAYREGRFDDALRCFPGPDPGERGTWWPRDQMMLARLHARSGVPQLARRLLDAVLPLEPYADLAVPVEYFGVSALAHLIAGDRAGALRDTDQGLRELESLRSEMQRREKQDLGESTDFAPVNVQRAVFDLAAVLAATGNQAGAVYNLTRLFGFDGWELTYLSRDPLLAPLLGHMDEWPELARWVEHERST